MSASANRGQGADEAVRINAFTVSSRLFDLPYEEKMKASHPNGHTPHRGYLGNGKERGAVKTYPATGNEDLKQYTSIADCKESYEVGSKENKVQYNIWLPEERLLGCRNFTTSFFWELNKTAGLILNA